MTTPDIVERLNKAKACNVLAPAGEIKGELVLISVETRDLAVSALQSREAEIGRLREERDRVARNRDMWKGQCERQAAQLEALHHGKGK